MIDGARGMELALKYVYEVYKEKSFSKAAKALYVSQPALSATVARLEKELSFHIFDRSKQPLELTRQGRVYIESIEEIIESENNMRRRIRELSDMSYGNLVIGGQSYTSYFIMAEICGAFYKEYPNIGVKIDIGNKGEDDVLWDRLKDYEIDLLFSYKTHSNYIVEPIFIERMVVAIHKSVAINEELKKFALGWNEVVGRKYDKEKEIKDPSIFKDVEFLEFGKGSITTRKMDELIGDYKTSPYNIVNVRHSGMHYNLMCAGVGAVMTTDFHISKSAYEAENINFFVFQGKNSYRTTYLLRNHSTEGNPIIDNFVKVAKEVCNKDGI